MHYLFEIRKTTCIFTEQRARKCSRTGARNARRVGVQPIIEKGLLVVSNSKNGGIQVTTWLGEVATWSRSTGSDPA